MKIYRFHMYMYIYYIQSNIERLVGKSYAKKCLAFPSRLHCTQSLNCD